MAEKEIRFKLTGDSSNLNKSLDDAQKKASEVEKASQKSVSSLSAAANALVTAFAGAKIFDFFKGAVAEATKLEQAFAKVEANARAFGQSTTLAKDAAISLAKDGFLSVSQSAQTLSNLMAVGLNIDQAKKFITASKDVTAFGNTIGDASQAVQDLSLGLLRGSALVIDNASPALKSLANQYQHVADTQGKQKAAQVAYNELMKLSGKFAGDAARYMDTYAGSQARLKQATEETSAAIGSALAPVFRAINDLIVKAMNAFTEWFKSLAPAAQTILMVGAAVFTLIPAFAALIPLIASVNVALGALLLNPVVLILAAVVGAVTALGVAYANAQPKMTEFEKKIANTLELKEKIKAMEKAGATTQELANANKQLAASEAEVIGKYREGLAALNAQNEAMRVKMNLVAALDHATTELTAEGVNLSSRQDIDRQIEIEKANIRRAEGTSSASGRVTTGNRRFDAAANSASQISAPAVQISGFENARRDDLMSAARADAAAAEAHESGIRVVGSREKAQARLAALLNAKGRLQAAPVDVQSGKAEEQRFLETRKKLAQILANEEFTIQKAKTDKITAYERNRRIDNAKADAEILRQTELAGLRKTYAQYIEDKYMADLENTQQGARAARKASRELLEAEMQDVERQVKHEGLLKETAERKLQLAKEQNVKRLADIEITENRKIAQARAETLTRTLSAADAIANGIGKFSSSDIAGGAASIFSGAGGIGKELESVGVLEKGGSIASIANDLGTIASIVGAVGSLGSAIAGLFGESDAERQREAEEQKRRDEETKAILELQANYQKSMLALQEAQAKLPFENLQRNLRLIDIQAQQKRAAGGDENTIETERLNARQAALQGTLTEQAGTISGGQLFSGTAATPEALIQFLNDRAGQNLALQQFIQLANLLSQPREYSTNYIRAVYKQMRTYKGKIPDAVYNPVMNRFEDFLTQVANSHDIFDSNFTPKTKEQALSDVVNDRFYGVSSISFSGNDGIGIGGIANSLGSEITSDTSTAENLLSVIDQSYQTQLDIAANTKKTADNTSLQLEKDRGDAFIDIVRGGLAQGAQFGSFLSPAPLSLSSAAAGLTLSSSIVKSIDERNLDQLIMLLQVSKDMRALLAEIAINTSGPNGDSTGFTSSELLALMSEFKSRS